MPFEIQSKTILNKTKRRDPWFLDDFTLNPSSGYSFNYFSCYFRGSKYGEHMEEKLAVKTNAVELLDKALTNRAKKDQYGIIVLSSATDPYLQVEKRIRAHKTTSRSYTEASLTCSHNHKIRFFNPRFRPSERDRESRDTSKRSGGKIIAKAIHHIFFLNPG